MYSCHTQENQAEYAIRLPVTASQEDVKEKQVTHTHEKNKTTNEHTDEPPQPHSTTIEGGATTVRTTSHARLDGRSEVSVGGRVEVRRALGCARVRRAPAGPLRPRQEDVNTFLPRSKGCEEKHSRTAVHHPVIKPPAVVSTAVSHTPTQQQGSGNY